MGVGATSACVFVVVCGYVGARVNGSEWRFPKERAELVELVVRLEKKCRLLEAENRALQGPERDVVSGLMGRIAELEAIVEKQNARLVAKEAS